MSYDFSTDQPNPYYDPNYDTPKPKSEAEKVRAANARAAAYEKRRARKRKRPVLSPGRIKEAAEEMEHQSSYENKPRQGFFL